MKYTIGQKVKHISKNKVGTITGAFDDGLGGTRYYVVHSGGTWSVPETALTPVARRNRE